MVILSKISGSLALFVLFIRTCSQPPFIVDAFGFPFIQHFHQRLQSTDTPWKTTLSIQVDDGFSDLIDSETIIQSGMKHRLQLFQITLSGVGSNCNNALL